MIPPLFLSIHRHSIMQSINIKKIATIKIESLLD